MIFLGKSGQRSFQVICSLSIPFAHWTILGPVRKVLMVLMGFFFFFFLKKCFISHQFSQHIACTMLYRICFVFIVLQFAAYRPGGFSATVLSHQVHPLKSGLEEDGGVCTVIGCEAAERQLIRHHVSDMCDMCDVRDIQPGAGGEQSASSCFPSLIFLVTLSHQASFKAICDTVSSVYTCLHHMAKQLTTGHNRAGYFFWRCCLDGCLTAAYVPERDGEIELLEGIIMPGTDGCEEHDRRLHRMASADGDNNPEWKSDSICIFKWVGSIKIWFESGPNSASPWECLWRLFTHNPLHCPEQWKGSGMVLNDSSCACMTVTVGCSAGRVLCSIWFSAIGQPPHATKPLPASSR